MVLREGRDRTVEKKRKREDAKVGDEKKIKLEDENLGSCTRRQPERNVEELTAAVAIDFLNQGGGQNGKSKETPVS